MTTENVNSMELVPLADYFSPKKFRLLPDDALTRRGGISEVQVVFNLHKDFTKKLNFPCSSMLILYGYAILNEKLTELNGAPYTTPPYKGKLRRIELNDCGERFVMVISLAQDNEILYAVTANEVAELLNQCLHPSI